MEELDVELLLRVLHAGLTFCLELVELYLVKHKLKWAKAASLELWISKDISTCHPIMRFDVPSHLSECRVVGVLGRWVLGVSGDIRAYQRVPRIFLGCFRGQQGGLRWGDSVRMAL